MFARSIFMRLKPNSVREFIQTLQDEIDPLLRKARGFRGHIAFVVADGTEAVAISFWDKEQSEMSQNDRRCEVLVTEVLVTMGKLFKGPPDVRVCEISNSISDRWELFHSLAHMVEGAPHTDILEVPRSIFRAIAAEGLAGDQQGEVS